MHLTCFFSKHGWFICPLNNHQVNIKSTVSERSMTVTFKYVGSKAIINHPWKWSIDHELTIIQPSVDQRVIINQLFWFRLSCSTAVNHGVRCKLDLVTRFARLWADAQGWRHFWCPWNSMVSRSLQLLGEYHCLQSGCASPMFQRSPDGINVHL